MIWTLTNQRRVFKFCWSLRWSRDTFFFKKLRVYQLYYIFLFWQGFRYFPLHYSRDANGNWKKPPASDYVAQGEATNFVSSILNHFFTLFSANCLITSRWEKEVKITTIPITKEETDMSITGTEYPNPWRKYLDCNILIYQ